MFAPREVKPAAPSGDPNDRLVRGFLYLGFFFLGYCLVPLAGIKLLGFEVVADSELFTTLLGAAVISTVLGIALAVRGKKGFAAGMEAVKAETASALPFGGAVGFVGGFLLSAFIKGEAIYTALTVLYAAAVIWLFWPLYGKRRG